jgi:hypothetical protein
MIVLCGAILVTLLAGLMASPAYAQGPGSEPLHSDPNWQVSYWNNTALSGPASLQRQEAHLNWDWGWGSPHAVINPDGFSARWMRYLDLQAATYRFTATSDDGIRIWVDNRLIIDEWHDHSAQTYTADLGLQQGHHLVRVEYYENEGLAVAKVSWAQVSGGPDQWQGEYYNNRWLSGAPVTVRGDAQIDYNWGYGSPGPDIPSDRFSVRWTRTLDLQAGTYRFTTTTDDGVRLWVNGHLLIDRWVDQPFRSHSGVIYLSGHVPLTMEYYENEGAAAARLTWAREDDVPPPPPPGEVVVDDTSPGFTKGGSPTGWRTAAGGYGGTATWTLNNDRSRPNYNWARWYPDPSLQQEDGRQQGAGLQQGRYEVLVYVPPQCATTQGARYWIAHRNGFAMQIVNQAANGGHWVSLGTYWFRGQGNEYVSLADVTYEPYLSHRIAFDAVKWVPR